MESNLPVGWKWGTIADCIIPAKAVNPSKEPERKFTYIDISAIDRDKHLITQPTIITGKKAPSRARKGVKLGSILFATTRPNLKNVAIIEEAYDNAVASTGFCVLNPSNSIEGKYLFYYLISENIQKQIQPLIRGAQYPAISDKDLLSCSLPIPSILEQKKIIAKLDKLFERIDEATALLASNIRSMQSLLTSLLNEVFGELEGKYEQKALGSFDKIVSGGTPLRSNQQFWGGNIPWITSGELNETYISQSREFITELGLKNSNAKLFPAGTLLCGMYDTAAMKMSILNFDATCNQAIVGIKPNPEVLDNLFLKYQLEYLKPKVLEQRQGVRQQNLNAAKIKAILLTVPPLSTQHRIKKYIAQIENKQLDLINKQKQKHSYLTSLKASILDAAFKGELCKTSLEVLSEKSDLVAF